MLHLKMRSDVSVVFDVNNRNLRGSVSSCPFQLIESEFIYLYLLKYFNFLNLNYFNEVQCNQYTAIQWA